MANQVSDIGNRPDPAAVATGAITVAGAAGDAVYRLLFERNPWPMWVYAADSLRFLAVNRAAIAGYGYSEAEFLAMAITDLRPEQDRAALLSHLATLPDGPTESRHWRHRRRSGEVFDVEVVSEPIDFGGRRARLVLAKDITQRLRAEAALRASERRYRDIVETAGEGIWAVDAQARTRFVNPKMAQMLGCTVDEMAGRPLTDFIDPDSLAQARDLLERRHPGVVERHEFRFRRRDGGTLWVSMAVSTVRDEAGDHDGALAMVTDIGERRQVEQQLKLLASGVSRFNDIVIITEAEPIDEPGPRILFVNDAFERRTGYRRAEALGRSPRLLQGPGTDRATLARIRQALQRWQPVRAEVLNYTKSGDAFWLELDIVPVADDKGWFTHWVAVEHDITERKRTEARDAARNQVTALIAAGAPLHAVLDALVRGFESQWPALQCSVLLLDAGGTRLLHGAAPSLPDFYNQAVDGLAIGPKVGSCGSATFLGQRVVVEDVRQDERWLPFRELAARAGLVAAWSEPVLSHAGAVLGAFGVYHRQPHLPGEAEIAAVVEAARMAAIAIERKHADEALRQSQKLESLGTLAGGIAHDFNNILGAILGNLALVRHQGDVGPDSAARLEQVRQSALRARHLVQQILAFGRRQPHQPQQQALSRLIDDTLGLLRATLPAGVRIVARLSEDVPLLAVDANQIQQVLMNLCTNAWHSIADTAGSTGEIEIGLDALTVDASSGPALAALPPGPCAHIWVRDNGAGMDAAIQARIFEPFFTTKPVGVGTGLGLAVVHGIVGDHRGTISVDSAPGRGTTFHLFLPVDPAGLAPGAPPPPPPAGPPAAVEAPASGPHILCVDDDAVILLTDEGLLHRRGFRVTSMDNGAAAVAAVREQPGRFDLVVSDFNMPETSGIDVAREIAAIRPDLPVVICSGYIDAELHRRAAQVGVRALVRKENTVEELVPTIQRVLSLARGAAPGPAPAPH